MELRFLRVEGIPFWLSIEIGEYLNRLSYFITGRGFRPKEFYELALSLRNFIVNLEFYLTCAVKIEFQLDFFFGVKGL